MAGSHAMIASLLSWVAAQVAAAACAGLTGAAVGCGEVLARAGVAAGRARAAGAAVPEKTPLTARAATVTRATAATRATVRQRRARSTDSLIVVARTRPHD